MIQFTPKISVTDDNLESYGTSKKAQRKSKDGTSLPPTKLEASIDKNGKVSLLTADMKGTVRSLLIDDQSTASVKWTQPNAH